VNAGSKSIWLTANAVGCSCCWQPYNREMPARQQVASPRSLALLDLFSLSWKVDRHFVLLYGYACEKRTTLKSKGSLIPLFTLWPAVQAH
jgi:nitroreductase